jgi:hypothetical protein
VSSFRKRRKGETRRRLEKKEKEGEEIERKLIYKREKERKIYERMEEIKTRKKNLKKSLSLLFFITMFKKRNNLC